MGEDSIILPIDRVIKQDVEGTRHKVDKRGYKLIRFEKRKFFIQQFIRGFLCHGKLVISLVCLLIICGCYLGVLGRGRGVGVMGYQGDFSSSEEGVDGVMLREDEMENIRRSIEEGLGLERIPDLSKANVSQTEYERAHVEYLRRLQMSRAPGDRRRRRLHTFHATDEMEQLLRTKSDLSSSPQMSTTSLYFPLDLPEEDTEVDHATLRLLLTPSSRDLVKLSIYRIGETSRHLFSSTEFPHLDGPRWIELDVTELVVLWHEGVIDNLGLEVHLENSLDAKEFLAHPALNVFTTADQIRHRRSAPDHLMSLHKGIRTKCHGDNKKCCRHEMTVIFKDIKGFEFIVQPKSFDAGYCKGRCPPGYNPAHHHAVLQSLISKEDRRKAPRLCCAPSKLAELEILYLDENDPTKLKVARWKKMRVLECACS